MATRTPVAPAAPGTRRPTSPGARQRLATGFAGPVRGLLHEAGEIGRFMVTAVMEVPGAFRYTSEILRQAALLITGSALVIFVMQFVMGMQCATEANYVLRGYGATAYTGVFTAFCSIRELAPYMWGYIVAAKIGCGLVAELGSMRINNEFDAMESLGINPMRYVVATRFVAALITFPLIFIAGLAIHMGADFLVIVTQIKEVSLGGFESVHWAFIRPVDILFAEIKIMTSGLLIVLVAMYYGYTARGGPSGVGTATARSMVLNLIVVHVTGSVLSMVFWGLNPGTPIGG